MPGHGYVKCIAGAHDAISGHSLDMVLYQYLSSGSFGKVMLGEICFRSHEGRPGEVRDVAVKEDKESRKSEFKSDQGRSCTSRLHKEARILSELSHEHIVKFEALVRREGTDNLYLATEFLQGPSLHSLFERQNLLPPGAAQRLYSEQDAGRWMLGLASALEVMHCKMGSSVYIHRDISVNNIILTSSNLKKAEAKLIDFGFAVKVPTTSVDDPCETCSNYSSCSLSKSHAGEANNETARIKGCGTFLHMAPEMLSGRGDGPKVDVFSFGMVLYQVFHFMSIKTILHRSGYTIQDGHKAMIMQGWRPAVSETCPPLIRDLTQKCWSADPGERPDFAAIVASLKNFSAPSSASLKRSPSMGDKVSNFVSIIKTSLLPSGIMRQGSLSPTKNSPKGKRLAKVVRSGSTPDLKEISLQASNNTDEAVTSPCRAPSPCLRISSGDENDSVLQSSLDIRLNRSMGSMNVRKAIPRSPTHKLHASECRRSKTFNSLMHERT